MSRHKAQAKAEKVVLDINILVSALFYPTGKPRLAWGLVESGRISSYTCDLILDKLLEVLVRPTFDKYGLRLPEKIGFVARVRHFISVHELLQKISA